MATAKPIQNLTLGSRGPEVSDLQQSLRQHGLYKGPIDGVYGPEMQSAVKQFQNMAGIRSDGIYGPQTTSQWEDWTKNPIKFAIADPAIQSQMSNNPTFANTMKTLAQTGGNQADMVAAAHFLSKASNGTAGYLDKNGNVDADVFKQTALASLGPNINQSIKYYGDDFAQGVQNEKAQYQSQLANQKQTLANQNAALQTSQGQNNNVNSGWGQTERGNFQNAANAGLNALQSGAQTRLSGLARNYENQLGTSALNDSGQNFNIAGAGNLGTSGTYQNGGNVNAYNPLGGINGQLSGQWLSQVNARAQNYRQGSYKQLPAYNQYVAAGTLGGLPSSYNYQPTQ